jgi:molybdate transport system regulatory protein
MMAVNGAFKAKGHEIAKNTICLWYDKDAGQGCALGPGKVRLLEAIKKTGSISQAGRTLGMSYRKTWLLADDMNNCFHDAVIATQQGGADGGGATLTPFGQRLVELYRSIENDAMNATRTHLDQLEAALKTPGRQATTALKRSLCMSSPKRWAGR